jgi:hypothetical protein
MVKLVVAMNIIIQQTIGLKGVLGLLPGIASIKSIARFMQTSIGYQIIKTRITVQYALI